MSFVTVLEHGPRPGWADYARDEFSSMQELCAETVWKRPAKVIAPDSDTLREFLTECDDEHGFEPSQFWMVKVGDIVLEHPTWDKLESQFEWGLHRADV